MKKRTNIGFKNELQKNQKTTKVEEPETAYYPSKQMRITKDFTFNEFKKVSDKVDLTQKEWSDILHISERTLQRYAKDNSTFNFSVIDRILLIDKVIKRGTELFGNGEDFISWLKDDPKGIEGELGLYSLASFDGITKVLNQLGRIEHGVLA
ncbi:MAG: antitoxin Xre-like helix-turn-helix domain-containing protein [Ginsengibacter sp.]